MKNLTIHNRLSTRILLTIVGTFLVALGIRLIVLSQLGADALSTFILGVIHHLPVQFGTVSLLINSLILVIVFFRNKELIGLASLINSFGIGLFLNLFDWLGKAQHLPEGTHYLAVIAGPILFALGTALYLLTNMGSGAYECLMMVVKNQFHLSVRTARILLDGFFMIVGFLLGGTIGIGTLLVLFLLGPTLEFFLQQLPKRVSFFKFD
ncbi:MULTISPECIES: YczE/YyaS/YitT family protein [Enterococcus]|uniref:YczE/YyaS/YitT family protein n=1 Tax=Enterococcus TaxID=1350 RepID=UPI00065E51A8|nr:MULTISPECIES: YitT family protein [Enterococcus]KAF1304878.1 hypothetical protein BAU16_01525 [Enterococcus sp. JM9B]